MKKLFLTAAALLLAAAFAADAFIRSIGAILALAGEDAFAAIFAQLAHARIVPGILPAALPALLFAWLTVRAKASAGRIPLAAAGFLTAWLVCVWTASVNGILFGDVMVSLAGLLGSGALVI